MKIKDRYVNLQIISGVAGPSIAICRADGCGERVAGSKPWGGGTIAVTKKISVEELLKVIDKNSFRETIQKT